MVGQKQRNWALLAVTVKAYLATSTKTARASFILVCHPSPVAKMRQGGASSEDAIASDNRSQRMSAMIEMMKPGAKSKIAIVRFVSDFDYPPAAAR